MQLIRYGTCPTWCEHARHALLIFRATNASNFLIPLQILKVHTYISNWRSGGTWSSSSKKKLCMHKDRLKHTLSGSATKTAYDRYNRLTSRGTCFLKLILHPNICHLPMSILLAPFGKP